MSQAQTVLDPARLIIRDNCPICSGHAIKLLDMPTINAHSQNMVSLNECEQCGHWWHNPLPEQDYLSSLYEADSEFVVSPHGLFKNTPPPESDVKKFADPILKDFKSSKKFNFLEIGSASGSLLKYFSNYAELVYGVEPAHPEGQLNVVGDIDLLPKDIKFDCVVIQDVLEHISDPTDMLKKIRERVLPQARIYAGFPNKDSLKAKLLKNNWSMMRPFGHLHYFSQHSLELMFEQAGWKVISCRPARVGDLSVLDVIKQFDTKSPRLVYRFFKSLILGQLILGKDQWKVVAVTK